MKITFGNYTYFDDNADPGTYVGTKGEWSGHYAFDENKFNTYKLNLLKDSKERVKYTIYFSRL